MTVAVSRSQRAPSRSRRRVRGAPSFVTRARNRAVRQVLHALVRETPRPDLVRLGTEYGGWWVPESLLGPGTVCYCAGVGEDASFDLALGQRGCQVLAFDPTPRSVAYADSLRSRDGFRFVAVGLAGRDGIARFYEPRNPSHVSHSMTNLRRTSAYFSAPVKTLATLMRDNGHKRLDLLKMDIEGAQHEVLDFMHSREIYPTVLCVEFDQPEPLGRTLGALRRLRRSGYTVAKLEGFNVTLVRDRPWPPAHASALPYSVYGHENRQP